MVICALIDLPILLFVFCFSRPFQVQTPSEKWGTGPGEIANSEKAVSNGAIPGMVHFFPALCNSKQLKAEWKRRGCQKL